MLDKLCAVEHPPPEKKRGYFGTMHTTCKTITNHPHSPSSGKKLLTSVGRGQDFYGNSPKTCRMLTQFQGTAKLSSGWSLLLRGDFVAYVLKLPCVICFTPWPHSQKERLSWISKPKWGMETHQHPCEHAIIILTLTTSGTGFPRWSWKTSSCTTKCSPV